MPSKYFLQERESFNQILVMLEHDVGTRDTCTIFLDAFSSALRKTRFRDAEDLRSQLKAFARFFPHLKPRMAIIQHYLDLVMQQLASEDSDHTNVIVERLVRALEEAVSDNAARNKRLVRQAIALIHNGNRILIHSHSHTVLDVLVAAKNARKSFEVIVAEQEASITHEIVEVLASHHIPFVVVPEYMLSEMESDISMMLIGAVTLKFDRTFVVHAGTRAIVSEMNEAKIPVHMLIATNKFSYWKTKPAQQTIKTIRTMTHPTAGFSYERMKFSHDRLPAHQVKQVITEEGVFSVEDLLENYRRQCSDGADAPLFDSAR